MNTHTVLRQLILCILCFLTTLSWAEPANNNSNQAEPEWIYTFRPNDTIWGICKEYCQVKNCWSVLARYNNIDKDRAIPPGTKLRIPTKWLNSQPIAATVVHAGDAEKETRNQELITLKRNDKIELQESLITHNRYATIKLADDSLLSIAPDTRITFDKISLDKKGLIVNTNIQLHKGSITSEVKKRSETHFQIQTPSAVAAVRGTVFRTSYDESNEMMLTEVDQGIVDVNSAHGSTELPEGYASSTKKDQAPSAAVKRLQAPELTSSLATPIRTGSQIKWKNDKAAAHYTVELADAQNSTAVMSSHITPDAKIRLPQMESGNYQLIVRAVDQQGFNGMPTINTISIDNTPKIPSIKTQWNKKKSELSWKPKKQTTSIEYTLELSNKRDFSIITHTTTLSIDQPKVTIEQPSKYARIKASSGKTSKHSKTVSLQGNKLWYWIAGAGLTGIAATTVFLILIL